MMMTMQEARSFLSAEEAKVWQDRYGDEYPVIRSLVEIAKIFEDTNLFLFDMRQIPITGPGLSIEVSDPIKARVLQCIEQGEHAL